VDGGETGKEHTGQRQQLLCRPRLAPGLNLLDAKIRIVCPVTAVHAERAAAEQAARPRVSRHPRAGPPGPCLHVFVRVHMYLHVFTRVCNGPDRQVFCLAGPLPVSAVALN
jgi:hypothetical protein